MRLPLLPLLPLLAPLSLVVLGLLAPQGAYGFVPPATVGGYSQSLTFCLNEGVQDNSATTLAGLTEGGTRVVVVANYYTGCTGGRREAQHFAEAEKNATRTFGARVLFVTNLVQSSTATNCAGWQSFSNQGNDAKPTILYSEKGGASSLGSKHLSYTFFNNLHPQYMVIDGNLRTHYYESNDLPGEKFTYAPGTMTYEGGDMQDTTCGGGEKTTLNYWNVESCLYRGYDKVTASLEGHIKTLPSSSSLSPSPSMSTSVSPSSSSLSPSPSSSASSEESGAGVSSPSSSEYASPSSSSLSPSPSSSASSEESGAGVSSPSSSESTSSDPVPCVEDTAEIGTPDTSIVTLAHAPAFGTTPLPGNRSLRIMVGPKQGKFNTPKDIQFHPQRPHEMWVADSGTADVSILTLGDRNTRVIGAAAKLSDRAKYHYMASVSALAFGAEGRFATCQESTNTYAGLTSRGPQKYGNRFMGPSLFDSNPALRVTQMGDVCTEEQLQDKNTTCFLRHIDMLHESPMCQGLVHDPEDYKCGSSSKHLNIFWAFDGWGVDNQTTSPRRGMLMRYDFERDHGGCNTYLCADHGEAEVRRYEDIVLTRQPDVVSHIAMDAHRDLWIADSGGRRLLRVDADSGRSARSAIYEFPIYSSTHLHFNYKIWSCTLQETFADGNHPGLLAADQGDNFMPAGVVKSAASRVVYVSNYVSGNIIAFDTYTSDVIATIETGRPSSLAGMTLYGEILYVVDQRRGEILRIQQHGSSSATNTTTSDGDDTERRPYPANPQCSAAAFDEPQVGPAIEHDPGYMNIAIPRDYASNTSIPCHDPETHASNFNLDALLMAGHTCHRCLPEPCLNGGVCTGVQEAGFTCKCRESWVGDMCQFKAATSLSINGEGGSGQDKDKDSEGDAGDAGDAGEAYIDGESAAVSLQLQSAAVGVCVTSLVTLNVFSSLLAAYCGHA